MSLDRSEHTEEIRAIAIRKIDDLRHKINSSEKIPAGNDFREQDQEFLMELIYKINYCLSVWHD